MIVSHEHKFIFLKTKKTAGTSIELALTELCGSDDVITPLTEIDEAQARRRRAARRIGGCMAGGDRSGRCSSAAGSSSPPPITASTITCLRRKPARCIDDKVWRSYFKFAFDRNPWDRQVSFYHHRYRNETAPPTFASFMHEDARARIDNYDIYSIDGDVAVDFVGRYRESGGRSASLRSVTSASASSAELPRAKTNFRRSTLPYRDYYDDETRGIVARWYAREIELLDYEF